MSAFLSAVRENCCKSSSSCERFPSLERRGYDNDNISLLSRRPWLEVCSSVEMFADWKLYPETEPPGRAGREDGDTLFGHNFYIEAGTSQSGNINILIYEKGR